MAAGQQRCDACGASWSAPVRWCGRCGAAIDPPEEASPAGPPGERAGGRSARPWVLAVVAVAVGGALVAGVVVATDGGTPPPVDDDVALPADEAVDRTADAGGGDGRRSTMACAPPGCEVWRVDDPVGDGVAVGGDLVLHVGTGEMVARDVAEGRERWRRPTPANLNRNPQTMAVSAHGVAFARDADSAGAALGTEPTADPDPARISIHDAADGDHRSDLQVDADVGLRLSWVGDRLVAVGSESVPGGVRGQVIVAAADGEVIWRHQSDGPVQLVLDGSTLLELDDDRVRRLDVRDGTALWEVSGRLVAPPVNGMLLVQDREAGEVRVVDFASGNTRATIAAEDARGARALGPWVLVAHDGELRVHDRLTGQLLFRREVPRSATEGPGPMRMATAVQAGDRVVVAWGDEAPDADEREVAVHTVDGDRERTFTVPGSRGEGPGPAPGPLGLFHVGPREDVVLVGSRGVPGGVAAVAVHSGEVLRRWAGRVVRGREGLVVLHREQGLTLLGPGGEIRVQHVDRVASLDPLVVHGAGGMLRLDRALVAEPR